ncbi:threonine/homoserine exporter RhtA [Kushneria phyllosphaerae]|uniref:Threonine/homoserine exporter RhtA n=1 Tax=Kushneria phyllosphaerae TaxID=2100822 RepID=A0A2R8CJ68_9GAMM|nr:threonine/homoserine exporter RhtA [Kushneria phyllosphaerae]SPJ32936.1 Threonine/homoserine exporter RhtA [Kushneria phyllosphaerae]
MSFVRAPVVQRLLPVALLVVAMSSIQSGASIAQQLFPLVGASGATSIRLLLAAILMLAIFRPWRQPLTRSAWKAITVYGVAMGLMNFLLYQALVTVPLGIAVALEFTGPLAVAVFTSRRRRDLTWIALAIVGLAILLWPDKSVEHGIDLRGALCALGAGVCWALYILFGRRAGSGNGTQSAALGITIAAIVMVPIGLVEAGTAILSPAVLPIGLAIAVLSTALPYTLEMFSLSRMPTHMFGTLMSLEPAIGALSGLIFLGQQLTALQWLAIGTIITASMGTTLTSRSAAPVQS